jgi:aminomethyltransferase
MIAIKYSDRGGEFKVKTNDDEFNCTIVEKPFYDPKKKIASS